MRDDAAATAPEIRRDDATTAILATRLDTRYIITCKDNKMTILFTTATQLFYFGLKNMLVVLENR
jgi:hypothetical protein